MELLLWLWFYDPKFFFNIKTSLQFYKNAILLPIIPHLFICFAGLYYLYLTESLHCDESFFIWQTFKIFFSFIFVAALFCLRLDIIEYETKERKTFSNVKAIYPMASSITEKADYWIKRQTLMSALGLLILFLSVISISNSVFIMSIYTYNPASACDMKLKSILHYHALLILISNSPLAISCFFMIFTKAFPALLTFTCPKALIKIRNAFWEQPILIKPYNNCF